MAIFLELGSDSHPLSPPQRDLVLPSAETRGLLRQDALQQHVAQRFVSKINGRKWEGVPSWG